MTQYTVRGGQLWHAEDEPDFDNGTTVVKLAEVREKVLPVLRVSRDIIVEESWDCGTVLDDIDALIRELRED